MVVGAILGGASIGAGVGLSSVVLAPFTAGNNLLGSFFFGYGMILGERMMYQEHWPKIQKRLANGEELFKIMEEYIREATNAIIPLATQTMIDVGEAYKEAILSVLMGAGQPKEGECPEGFYWDGTRCRPSTATKPPPSPPPPPPAPTGNPKGTPAQEEFKQGVIKLFRICIAQSRTPSASHIQQVAKNWYNASQVNPKPFIKFVVNETAPWRADRQTWCYR